MRHAEGNVSETVVRSCSRFQGCCVKGLDDLEQNSEAKLVMCSTN